MYLPKSISTKLKSLYIAHFLNETFDFVHSSHISIFFPCYWLNMIISLRMCLHHYSPQNMFCRKMAVKILHFDYVHCFLESSCESSFVCLHDSCQGNWIIFNIYLLHTEINFIVNTRSSSIYCILVFKFTDCVWRLKLFVRDILPCKRCCFEKNNSSLYISNC